MKRLNSSMTVVEVLNEYLTITEAKRLDPSIQKAVEAAFLGGLSAALGIIADVKEPDELADVGLRLTDEILAYLESVQRFRYN